MKFRGEVTPGTRKWQFSTPPAVKPKLVAIFSMSWEFPLIHVVVPFSLVSQVLLF